MNDKQQLAAMGAELRLTEEQAKRLAERIPKTGALQIIDDENLCMEKRIEELEAQVRVMAGALNEFREFASANVWDDSERQAILASIDAAMSGKTLVPSVPEGWQLVPVDPIKCIDMGWAYLDAARDDNPDRDWAFSHAGYRAMLAAAPKPDAAK